MGPFLSLELICRRKRQETPLNTGYIYIYILHQASKHPNLLLATGIHDQFLFVLF